MKRKWVLLGASVVAFAWYLLENVSFSSSRVATPQSIKGELPLQSPRKPVAPGQYDPPRQRPESVSPDEMHTSPPPPRREVSTLPLVQPAKLPDTAVSSAGRVGCPVHTHMSLECALSLRLYVCPLSRPPSVLRRVAEWLL